MDSDIFKKSKLQEEKLIPYGFKKENSKYIYTKKIMKDNFKVEIIINKKVITKVYDLQTNEEYTNYKVQSVNGTFVNQIRQEVKKILLDIKDKCFTEQNFISDQANRISQLIYEKYKDKPEFMWKKFPGYGVFKNKKNDKWYAVIMNINKNKLTKENKEIEVIDLKLNSDLIKELLKEKGYYKAYHMNKENWISIELDDIISDDVILKYIEESHKYTEQPTNWIIPANPKYYDIDTCFNTGGIIVWKQTSNINVGDHVYVYVTTPVKAIKYRCIVEETNIPYNYKDENVSIKKVMKLKLEEEYDQNKYTFEYLNKKGIKAIRGPIRLLEKL